MQRRSFLTVLSGLALVPELLAQSQKPAPATAAPLSASLSEVLDQRLVGIEKTLQSLTSAMPAEQYNFVPAAGKFEGMRSFAGHLKHTAFASNVNFAAILGEAIPQDDGSEDGPPEIKGREPVLDYLRDSFAHGHRAIASICEQNSMLPVKDPSGRVPYTTRLALAINAVSHCYMHYGELLIYARSAGVIPPG